MEDFVDVIGLRMKDIQDMCEVSDNLGQSYLHLEDLHTSPFLSKKFSYHTYILWI